MLAPSFPKQGVVMPAKPGLSESGQGWPSITMDGHLSVFDDEIVLGISKRYLTDSSQYSSAFH